MGGKLAEGSFRERAALQGRAAPAPSVPGPPGWPGLGPLRGPSPPWAKLRRRGGAQHPPGAAVEPGSAHQASCLSHGRPALGTVPGNHLWVTRRLSSRGTPSSTDLA